MRALLLLVWLPIQAVPLVGEDGAAELSEVDGRLVLQLGANFDAPSTGAAIRRALPEAQVLIDGSTIVVEGIAADAARKALARIQVEASPLDDVDALLAQLREPGTNESGSGSSIRARRETAAVRPGPTLIAKVAKVDHQKFPLVLLTLKTEGEVEGLKTKELVVLPRVRSQGGLIDRADEQSMKNLGAWYVRVGDRVQVALEDKPEDQPVWVASDLERIR